jgi:hypothetical protein
MAHGWPIINLNIGFQLWHPHQQATTAAMLHTSQFFSSGAVATGVVLGFSSHDRAGRIGGAGVPVRLAARVALAAAGLAARTATTTPRTAPTCVAAPAAGALI